MNDTRGTSYRATEDWRDDALCLDRWAEWELDHLDRRGVALAVYRCRFTCAVFAQCRKATKQQVADGHKPVAVVQAGHVWLQPWGKRRQMG